MTQTNPLTEKLRPYKDELTKAAINGDLGALEVIKLYQMYVACPADHGAPTFCEMAFDHWLKHKGPTK